MANKSGKNPNMSKRYTDEFKKQIVDLIKTGKRPKDVVDEYDISRATVNKWVNDFDNSGSFKAKDNRSAEENELIELRKQNAELKMEVDILKQAALIMGRKSK